MVGMRQPGEPNQTVQRTGASRFAQRQIERHRRLAPVADLCVKRRSMHHFPKVSKLTWAVVIGFAAIAIPLWFAGEQCEVRALNVGYTNVPPKTGLKYALYGVVVITNVGSGNITLWPEFLLEGEGAKTRRWRGTFHELTWIIPRGSARQIVPAPVSVQRWRLTVLCSPDCFRADVGEYLGTGHDGWARTVLRDWLHVIPVKRVSTQWISNQTLNPTLQATAAPPGS